MTGAKWYALLIDAGIYKVGPIKARWDEIAPHLEGISGGYSLCQGKGIETENDANEFIEKNLERVIWDRGDAKIGF